MLPLLPALLALACAPSTQERPSVGESALAGPMDQAPGRRTLAPSGRLEVVVAPGGALTVGPPGDPAAARPVDSGVDPRVALSPDEAWLVYARQGPLRETDLWIVALPEGTPAPLVAWPGSEDRPVFSPDGRSLAFVSGTTGIASWWRVPLDRERPVPTAGATQLTNAGLEHGPRVYGQPPPGFVPPPEGHDYGWTADGLRWFARGEVHQLPVPP